MNSMEYPFEKVQKFEDVFRYDFLQLLDDQDVEVAMRRLLFSESPLHWVRRLDETLFHLVQNSPDISQEFKKQYHLIRQMREVMFGQMLKCVDRVINQKDEEKSLLKDEIEQLKLVI